MRMPQQSRTVLHAEDSDDDAFFFERALAVANIAADLVRLTNGSAAIEYLERASSESKDLSGTHVLFLDLKMPGLTGFEVLQWIRDRNLALEVFVLSGSDLDGDVEAALALGAAAYFVKPISPAELTRRLGRVQHVRAP
jgi:CheY-like chemotaxis protein